MAKNFNHIELIERYLDNKMGDAERAEFENQLMHDPLLKGELDFQSDIISSLRSYRKAEIKERLNNISVKTAPDYFNLLKIAASISVSSVLVWGVYQFTAQPQDDVAPEQQVEVTVDAPVHKDAAPAMPPVPEKIIEKPLAEELQPVDNQSPARIDPKPEAAEIARAEQPQFQAPQVDLPNVMENFEDVDAIVDAEYPGDFHVSDFNALEDNDAIEIKVEDAGKKRQFHYQFYDGKLYLYGDFDQRPYEIIELNTANGRRLFLNYNDDFFSIRAEQKELAPLQPIEDPRLLNELNILQENKAAH